MVHAYALLIDPSWETARSLLALDYIKVREDVSLEYQVEEERLWIEDPMSWFTVTNAMYIGPLIFVQFTLVVKKAFELKSSCSSAQYFNQRFRYGVPRQCFGPRNYSKDSLPMQLWISCSSWSLLTTTIHCSFSFAVLRLVTSENTSVWQLWALEGVYQSPTGFIEDSSSPWLEFPSGDLWWLV